MKKLALLGAGLLILASTPAFAATDVTIPIGDWATGIGGFITTFATPLIAALVAFLFRNVPAAYVSQQNRDAVDHLLEKAIQFGINLATSKLPANVTVPMTNDIVAAAANYAIAHGPSIVAWAGGAQMIEEKILARLNVQPAAAPAAA